MPVTATSSVEAQRPVGDVWPISVVAVAGDGTPANAVTVTVTRPDGTTSTPTAEETSCGWRAEYLLAAPGRHVATVSATGCGSVAFVVTAVSATAAGAMPAVADVAAYLGSHSWSDPQLADALAVETAAQRARCAIPAYYPDDLRGALMRRVARNLGMRLIPLAQPVGDSEAGGPSVPPFDPEINRLERPHWRVLVA